MGIKWQTPNDVAKLAARITNVDRPRFTRYFGLRDYVITKLRGGYLGEDSPDYSTGVATNDVLEFMANLETDLAFQLPEAEVYTSKAGAAYQAARGSNHALNVWMNDSNYEKEIRASANDYLVGFAVRGRGVGPKSDLGPELGPRIDWPWSDRISPKRFGWDTDAESFEVKEYAWQSEQEYQHDLFERAKAQNEEEGLGPDDPGYWRLDVIKKLKDPPSSSGWFSGKTPHEGKLQHDTIYLPDADASELLPTSEKHPERYNGVQVYVAEDVGGEPGWIEIRNATPCMCPPEGPYTLIGMQHIPDESIPASVLLLTIGQGIAYNEIVSANNDSARDWKNLLLVDDKRLATLIESGKHNTVYYHNGLDKDRIVPAQVGGLSDQTQAQEERAERLYHRAVGLTDAERGATKGGVTATQDAIASGAATKRRDGQVKTFHMGIEEDLKGVLWLLYNTDSVIVEQGPDAVDEFKVVAPVFFGGDFDQKQIIDYYDRYHPEVELPPEALDEGVDIPFSDLQLRVRVGSMGRKTKAERIMETQGDLVFIQAFFQTLVQFPFWPVEQAKRWAAKRSGIVELPDFIDEGWLHMMRGLMLQAQAPPAVSGESEASFAGAGSRTVQPIRDRSSAQPQPTLQPQNTTPGAGQPSSQGIRNGEVGVGA